MNDFLIAIVFTVLGFMAGLFVKNFKRKGKRWNREKRVCAYKALGNIQAVADATANEDLILGLNRVPHIAFTRQVWKFLPLSCDDSEWLDKVISSSCVPVADIYRRLLESGFTKREIILLLKETLLSFSFHIFYLLDDNMIGNLGEELEGVGWGIYETFTDEKGREHLVKHMGCLHEFYQYFDLDSPDSETYLDEIIIRRQQL